MAQNRENLLVEADQEIDLFEKWFTGGGAQPLARFERAILKTYLLAKSEGLFRESSDQEQSPTSADEAVA